jgi:hypothetical protein
MAIAVISSADFTQPAGATVAGAVVTDAASTLVRRDDSPAADLVRADRKHVRVKPMRATA